MRIRSSLTLGSEETVTFQRRRGCTLRLGVSQSRVKVATTKRDLVVTDCRIP